MQSYKKILISKFKKKKQNKEKLKTSIFLLLKHTAHYKNKINASLKKNRTNFRSIKNWIKMKQNI